MNSLKTRTVGCWAALFALALSLFPTVGLAGEETRKLALKHGFFRPVRFVVGEEPPKPVYGFWGLSFKPEFEEVMSGRPAALDEARKSFAGNGISLVGTMGLLLGSIWLLADTLDDASDVSAGRMVDDSFNAGPVVVVGAGAVVMIVGSVISGSHLRKSIAMYNEREAVGRSRSGRDSSKSPGTTGQAGSAYRTSTTGLVLGYRPWSSEPTPREKLAGSLFLSLNRSF